MAARGGRRPEFDGKALHEFHLLRGDGEPQVHQDLARWHLENRRRLLQHLFRLDPAAVSEAVSGQRGPVEPGDDAKMVDSMGYPFPFVLGGGKQMGETGLNIRLGFGLTQVQRALARAVLRITSPGTAQWIELICPSEVQEKLCELGASASHYGAQRTPQFQLLGQFLRSVEQHLPQLTDHDLPSIEQTMLCLVAAARQDSSGEARLSEVGHQTVDRAAVVAAIERELFSARLTTDRVCTMTGIFRSSLYRLFEEDKGVASYIRLRRLDALRSELVDPGSQHQSVAQLAEGRALHSPSTLNRAIRRRFGCTPGECRATPARLSVSPDAAKIT